MIIGCLRPFCFFIVFIVQFSFYVTPCSAAGAEGSAGGVKYVAEFNDLKTKNFENLEIEYVDSAIGQRIQTSEFTSWHDNQVTKLRQILDHEDFKGKNIAIGGVSTIYKETETLISSQIYKIPFLFASGAENSVAGQGILRRSTLASLPGFDDTVGFQGIRFLDSEIDLSAFWDQFGNEIVLPNIRFL